MKRPVTSFLTVYEPLDRQLEDFSTWKNQAIGVMAMIDLHYWGGYHENNLGDCVQDYMQAIESNCFLIIADKHKSPLAYLTWKQLESGLLITRQSAPFGHHLDLLNALRKQIPSDTPIYSLHEDSPSRIQSAL